MTIKERLVEIIASEGFDLVTACEMASTTIAEFKASDKARVCYVVRGTTFVLTR